MKISRVSMAALAVATILAAGSGIAKAASVFGPGGPEGTQTNVNEITYHNYESVFNSSGVELSPSTPLSSGDYIVGVLQINNIAPPSAGTPTFTNGTSEITGVFVQKVTINASGLPNAANSDPNQYTILLGTSDRNTFTDNLGNTITTNVNTASGAMFNFYLDTTPDFVATGVSMQASVNSAMDVGGVTGTTPYFSLGLAAQPGIGEPNTGYFYSTTDNVSNPQTLALNGYGGLNFLTNNTGVTFKTVFDTTAIDSIGLGQGSPNTGTGSAPPVGFIIDSNISFNKANTFPSLNNSPWGFISSDPADVSVLVPVPAAAWTGMSMLAGLGCIAAIRRRKLANA